MSSIRLWHRVLAWVGLHPRVARALRMAPWLIAVFGLALTLWLHSDDSSKIASDRASQRSAQQAAAAASAAIDPVVCKLVYVYVHPVSGTAETGRSDQVGKVWALVGSLVGCPYGTKP